MSEVTIQNILAFGNFVYSEGKAPNAIAPRLDFRERSEVIEDGKANLFRALQWRYQMAPTLQGRDEDIQSILDWAEGGGNTISVRMLTGAGGTGKTRLAAEAARILRKRGWAAGFVPRGADSAQTIETELRRFLLIFDYPEERMDVLRGLFEAIRDIPNSLVEFPIRILLVSRREIDDWQDMARRSNISLGRQELAHLSALDVMKAREMFAETASHFADLTGAKIPLGEGLEGWFAAEATRRVPLVVMAAAIHAVLTGRVGFGLGATELINDLANWERTRAENVSIQVGLGQHALPRLIALAALAQRGLSDAQCVALAELDVCETRGQALIDRLEETPWRRRSTENGRFELVRPEPDRMAASFVAQVLLDKPAMALPDWIGEVASPQGGSFGDVISRIGYDLLGNQKRWFDELHCTLEEMIARHPERITAFRDIAFRKATAFSARFALTVIQKILKQNDLDTDNRALLLHNHGYLLSILGQREAALKSAETSTSLRRQMALARPEAFTPELAASLRNLAVLLSELGQREAALQAAQEAVDIYRQLVRARPEVFTPGLATSLNNVSILLSDLGQREAALKAALEASDFHRKLVATRGNAFKADFAISLNTLAARQSELGKREEALQTAQEALSLCRLLEAERPDTFAPNLARSLANSAKMLSELGQREAALVAMLEVVSLYRELVEAQSETFEPDLATSLDSLAKLLSDLGKREDALVTAQEAVNLRRRLADVHPEKFTPVLAASLDSLANRFSEIGQREAALQTALEAVNFYRELDADRIEAFAPDLARSLNSLAIMLSHLGQFEAAQNVATEAVAFRRQLAEDQPEAFMHDLAASLNTLANRLAQLGRRKAALEHALEAVGIYRRLALKHPEAFTANLAASLNNLAGRHSELRQRKKALQAAQEAVVLRRQLATTHPEAFAPDLASSLHNLTISLSELGHPKEALEAALETVELRRQLSATHPETFSPDLAMSLFILSICLSELGHRKAALQAARESVEVLSPSFFAVPLRFSGVITNMAETYLKLCFASQVEPCHALLTPLKDVLEKLPEQKKLSLDLTKPIGNPICGWKEKLVLFFRRNRRPQ